MFGYPNAIISFTRAIELDPKIATAYKHHRYALGQDFVDDFAGDVGEPIVSAVVAISQF